MREIYKNIVGYEGLYQVSNIGNVKSLPRIVKENFGGERTTKERILKRRIDNKGYDRVALYLNNKPLNYRVHRLVAMAFIFNKNKHPQINHKDGNKLNNSVNNLEWCTNTTNMDHAKRNGLRPKKLLKSDVLMIKKLITKKHKVCDLARQYKVSPSTICDIKSRRIWTWL